MTKQELKAKGTEQTATSVTLKDLAEVEIPEKYQMTFDECKFFYGAFHEKDGFSVMLELYRLAYLRGQQAAWGRPKRKAPRNDYTGGLVQIYCPREYWMTTEEVSRIYNEGGGIYWKLQKVFNLAFDRGHAVGYERGQKAATR